jgi:hypothetical protein
VIASFGLGLGFPAGALGAGGPVPPVQGGSGIAAAGSPFRYSAFDAGHDTVIKRLTVGGGRAESAIRVSGRYGIPGVDYSGSVTGLSADGGTLILAEFPGNGPPRMTRLLVLDTRRLAVRARLALPGWSTVDAISPDGRWLYLIHYISSDNSRYEVRAYDLPARRLMAQPVVDPRDHGEAMIGFAITRVMSADGRWAYTLYSRPSGAPFVHALDTAGRRAVCVDLPSVANTDIGSASLRLGRGGANLRIDADGVTRAVINTRTFVVTPGVGHALAPIRSAPLHGGRGTSGAGGWPWELVAVPIAALAALGAAARRRAKPRVT